MLRRIGATVFAPAIAFACLCWPGAAAQTAGQSGNSTMESSGHAAQTNTDRTFIRKAAEGGLAEVELGQLAQQKAQSPEVKQFGERMATDHAKANQELKNVASNEGVPLPNKLDAKDAATKARLEKLSGAEFDRAYMRDMVTDHTKDVREFEREASSAKDPAVKNFAAQTLPTLQDHLKQAKNVAQTAGATQTKRHSPTGTE